MRMLAPDEDPREGDCPTCGADVDHGEPHYGDCTPDPTVGD